MNRSSCHSDVFAMGNLGIYPGQFHLVPTYLTPPPDGAYPLYFSTNSIESTWL